MDCTRLEECLDLLLANELTPEDRLAAEQHLAACTRCSELHGIATGRLEILPEDQSDRLTAKILNATSGPVCDSVEGLLVDYADGELPSSMEDLVADHLNHCADCSALAVAIQQTTFDLSTMAEMRPDDAFVADVLAATSEWISLEERLRAGVSGWWKRQIRRPRFAVEVAYSVAMLFFLIFGMPNSPLRDLAPTTSDLARVNPVQAAVDFWQGSQEGDDGLGDLGRDAWNRTGRPVTRTTRRLWAGAGDTTDRVGDAVSLGWNYVQETAGMAWEGEFVEAWRLLGEMKTQVWKRLKGEIEEFRSDESEP